MKNRCIFDYLLFWLKFGRYGLVENRLVSRIIKVTTGKTQMAIM